VACVSWTIRRLEKPVIIQSLEFLILFVQAKRIIKLAWLEGWFFGSAFTRLTKSTIRKSFRIKLICYKELPTINLDYLINPFEISGSDRLFDKAFAVQSC